MKTKLIIFDGDNCLWDTEAIRESGDVKELQTFEDTIFTLRSLICTKMLVTAGNREVQLEKIRITGIAPFFSNIFVCPLLDNKKKVFREILYRPELMGVVFDEVSVVGDRVNFEIRFGKELGFRTVRMKYGKHSGDIPKNKFEIPDFEITKLSELLSII